MVFIHIQLGLTHTCSLPMVRNTKLVATFPNQPDEPVQFHETGPNEAIVGNNQVKIQHSNLAPEVVVAAVAAAAVAAVVVAVAVAAAAAAAVVDVAAVVDAAVVAAAVVAVPRCPVHCPSATWTASKRRC